MGKLVFLDIDGTIINFNKEISESTIKAIKKAQENGHKVFICSGRMYGIIDDFIKDIGFDGYVASAGARVIVDGKDVFYRTIEPDKLVKAWEILKAHKSVFRFKGISGVCMGPDEYRQMLMTEKGKMISKTWKFNITDDVAGYTDMESGDYNNADITVDEMQKEFDEKIGEYFTVIMASFDEATPYFGEVLIKGVNKGSGIAEVVKYLGAKQEDTIGIGDSSNDIDMLNYVGTAVAMGNALNEVKELADFVTTDVDNDGIWNAFKKLNLI